MMLEISVKKQNTLFKTETVLKRPRQKFRVDLGSFADKKLRQIS